MVRLALFALFASAAVCSAAAQQPTAPDPENNPPGVGIKVSFRPSVAIVIGIFTMIFALTILLLMYAKFCHPPFSSSPRLPATQQAVPVPAGVPKPVIQSLPFFRFATLRGARRGMECVVCLAAFAESDLLRLLPRCRHAFHLDCVDRWLETSASCPLCRAPVDADTIGVKYAASARIVFGGGDDGDGADAAAGSGGDLLDIFVERVPSSRFVVDGAPRQGEEVEELDRHRHRIVVSDAVFKSRWSELNRADLVALDAEMLRRSTSFPCPAEEELDIAGAAIREEGTTTTTENKQLLLKHGPSSNVVPAGVRRGSVLSTGGRRSVSEIVSLPRRLRAPMDEDNRRWLPIARRTARWFAGRAKHGDGGEDEEGGAVHVGAGSLDLTGGVSRC